MAVARQNPAANLNFGFGTADEVRRQFLIPLWNVYSFFVTYANIDEFDPRAEIPLISERTELDRWILSELNSLTREVTKALESFEPENVTREVEQFTEYLSNWYIRRSRRRFWKSGLLSDSSEDSNHDKLSAYSTLYETLVTLTKLLAPVVPFITESIYQNLVTSQALGKESVHLEEYPVTDRNIVERELSERTRLAMRLSSMGRSARSKAGIKVRQPLEHIYVHTRTVNELGMLPLIEDQLLDELNVKHVTPVADAAEIVSFQIQPNLPVLGPRYGKKLGAIRSALELADPSDIKVLVDAGHNIELGEFTLEPGEILISAIELDGVSSVIDSGYAVGISSDISPELREEGTARELVHRIQNMRRSAGFEISDHINLWISGSDELSDIVEKHFTYFKEETLAENISSRDIPVDCYIENHDLDGKKATVAVMKV